MVSDVSFPRVNGVSTSIQTFRRSLAELGHESVLVAPDYAEGGGPRVTAAGPDERTVPAVDADGLECVRVRARPVPRDPEDRLMRHGDVVALADRLAARRFDVLHVHTPFVAHYAGIALARRLGLPVVETYHTFFEEYLHHYVPLLPRALTRYAARAFTRSQCRQVDALVVPSGQMLATLRGYGVATRAEVLPTGIDLARFAGGDGAAFRRAHGIPPDRPVLVHISRVAHEKNIDFVLRAVAQVRREVPDVLLVIAGEGRPCRTCGGWRASWGSSPTCCSSATWTAAPRCSTATAPATRSCSPRAPRRRGSCCSRRWRSACRWSRPR